MQTSYFGAFPRRMGKSKAQRDVVSRGRRRPIMDIPPTIEPVRLAVGLERCSPQYAGPFAPSARAAEPTHRPERKIERCAAGKGEGAVRHERERGARGQAGRIAQGFVRRRLPGVCLTPSATINSAKAFRCGR